MASPLIVLVACAVAVGIAGSIFIIIPLAVDDWEEYQYDDTTLQQYTSNKSDVYEVVLPTEKNGYIKFTVKNTSTSHYVYPEFCGVWKMCDRMSGKQIVWRVDLESKWINACADCNERVSKWLDA